MSPEAAAFLAKAGKFLEKARNLLEVLHYPDEAGRAAYLAGLHAAQALVFERTGKVTRSHRGVQRELYRLSGEYPGFEPDLRTFLGRSYNLKSIADYQTGAAAEVSTDEAQTALEIAVRLVARITTLLG